MQGGKPTIYQLMAKLLRQENCERKPIKMKALNLIAVIALSLVLATVCESQDAPHEFVPPDEQNPKVPILVDEFGSVGECDAGARIDNLFIQLNNNPDTTAYVITYSGVDFLPSQFDDHPNLRRFRQAIGFRHYDTARVVFIDGGFRDEAATEFWLVPPGATHPVPTKTVPKPEVPINVTFLWGRSWVSDESEFEGEFVLPAIRAKQMEEQRLADIEWEANNPTTFESSNDETNSAENDVSDDGVNRADEEKQSSEELEAARFSWVDKKFAPQIAGRETAHGVIIFYADDRYYDTEKIQRFVETARDRIATEAKLPSLQIKVIFGGYRAIIEVEYWVVPIKGKSPAPRPAERPVEGLTNDEG
jgi:hypothetical protein